MRPHRLVATALTSLTALLAASVPAGAGVVAAMSLRDETTTEFNVLVFDPLDPSRSFGLPAAAQTTDPQLWPQLAAEGTKLLYIHGSRSAVGNETLEYVDRSAATVSTVTLPTDSFGKVAQFALSQDGRTIVTNVRGVLPSGDPPLPTASGGTVLDSTALPAGPFPELASPVADLPDEAGTPLFRSANIFNRPSAANSRRFAWISLADSAGDFVNSFSQQLIVGIAGGQTSARRISGTTIRNPVHTPSDVSTITFDDNSRLKQIRLTATPTITTLTLPNVTFSTDTHTNPVWSESGRYLAWVTKPFTGSGAAVPVKVFVYDTQTQSLVRSDGRSLGSFKFAFGLTVNETPPAISTFTLSSQVISPVQPVTLNTTLLKPNFVGILVQRVSGKTKLLGRTVPRLVTVGRVPLGQRKKGRNAIGWNGKVGGKRLAPGTYKITMRVVGKDGKPTDLSKPVTLRVR